MKDVVSLPVVMKLTISCIEPTLKSINLMKLIQLTMISSMTGMEMSTLGGKEVL